MQKTEVESRAETSLIKAEEVKSAKKTSKMGFLKKGKSDKEILQEQLEHLNNFEDALGEVIECQIRFEDKIVEIAKRQRKYERITNLAIVLAVLEGFAMIVLFLL